MISLINHTIKAFSNQLLKCVVLCLYDLIPYFEIEISILFLYIIIGKSLSMGY
ncbi:hypothetical protein Lalb_Chr05g0229361 [Lupinus albus]|uniref:Uncharacterized protein n=1 Tax=Lupinus albus TaxID=3870 RepID=A0A6A4QK43_LUPAL|nr:hypothetical protein Lalb_Chr05g0229361 [Lupinus albus]